ncbi:hypothetical protein AHAS_Ahas02G0167100 [Arachis hypogaea]
MFSNKILVFIGISPGFHGTLGSQKNSCCNGDSFQNDITADDVRKAVLELISNVRFVFRKTLSYSFIQNHHSVLF